MSSNETELPWYELDRLILSSFFAPEWHPTRYITIKVVKACKTRNITMSGEQVFERILQMVSLGTLAVGGDISQWRRRTQVRIADDLVATGTWS